MKGKLITETDRKGLIEYINKLILAKPFYWEIKRKVVRRSISQNSLYWMWLTCIQEETGNDRNDLHEYFKNTYINPTRAEIFNEIVRIQSTKNLTTTQFKEYLDVIQVKMSQEGIILPNPDDLIWDSFYDHYKDRL